MGPIFRTGLPFIFSVRKSSTRVLFFDPPDLCSKRVRERPGPLSELHPGFIRAILGGGPSEGREDESPLPARDDLYADVEGPERHQREEHLPESFSGPGKEGIKAFDEKLTIYNDPLNDRRLSRGHSMTRAPLAGTFPSSKKASSSISTMISIMRRN